MRFGTLIVMMLFVGNCLGADIAAPSGSHRILPEDAHLETLWEDGVFTEGVAVAPDGTIYFSDISRGEQPGRILRFHPETMKTTVFSKNSGQSNGLMFDRNGNLIASCGANHGARALVKFRDDGTYEVLVDNYQGKKLNSPNDLVILPNGDIFFSDPRYVGPETVELDHMSVFRFSPSSKELQRVTSEITKPNGVILSPDVKTIYIAETNNGTTNIEEADQTNLTKRMTLNAFDVQDSGMLRNRRILVDFGDKLGVDGMTMDQKGRIYAAVRSADRFGIRVYEPDGTEVASIPTPDLPTNCCFGGKDDPNVLYITAGTGLYRIRLKSTGFHPAIRE